MEYLYNAIIAIVSLLVGMFVAAIVVKKQTTKKGAGIISEATAA